MAWIAAIVGERFARPVFYGLIVAAIFVAGFTVARCTKRPDTSQAEQTSKSGDAIANAAASAIETIGNRTVSDVAVDRATVQATKGIDDAQDVDAVRRAVLDGVCNQAAHSRDPACAVR